MRGLVWLGWLLLGCSSQPTAPGSPGEPSARPARVVPESAGTPGAARSGTPTPNPANQAAAAPAEPSSVEATPEARTPAAAEEASAATDVQAAQPGPVPPPGVTPALANETVREAITRCDGTQAPDPCLASALEGRELRAAARVRLVEAYQHLGRDDDARRHMRLFLDRYPHDRRGNRYHVALQAAAEE